MGQFCDGETDIPLSGRNTCNVFAKTSPYVLQPEKFALDLALHFVDTYVSSSGSEASCRGRGTHSLKERPIRVSIY